jgi:hypothetical protein
MPIDQFDGIAYGLCPIMHTPAAPCDTCRRIANAIRAAVEAENKACARACESGGMVNGAYFAAAIRARGGVES